MLQQCSAAAVLLAHHACVALRGCRVAHCVSAFLAGQGGGGRLELRDSVIERSAVALWADPDRPRTVLCGEGVDTQCEAGDLRAASADDGSGSEEDSDVEMTGMMAELWHSSTSDEPSALVRATPALP